MTPETARALKPGTTPGPWKWQDNDGEGFGDRYYDFLGNDTDHALETQDCEDYSSWVIASDEDKDLIAAAPDMRATIAALRWEYGVERDDVTSNPDPSNPDQRRYVVWYASEDNAHYVVGLWSMTNRNPRLVRRLLGPVEVVE